MKFGRSANNFLFPPRQLKNEQEETEVTEKWNGMLGYDGYCNHQFDSHLLHSRIQKSFSYLCFLCFLLFKSFAMNASSEKSRILIADDNEPNVELLEAYLGGLDVETAVAVDGQDTLGKVASFKPHLVLLDIMMPKLSGFEVCKKLKSDPATSHIMILMVTALNELGDIERAVQAGTDDFLSKPVNKAELLKRVDNMLKLHHVTDEVERLRQYIERMESRG